MIKQLIQLILPKKLELLGSAFAIGSFAFGVSESKNRADDVQAAQDLQSLTETAIRNEQAGRSRRDQVRTGLVLGAQAQNVQLASGSGRSTDTPISSASASIDANFGRNIGAINTSLASSGALSSARSNVANAGRPSTIGIFNQQLQPLLFSNIDKLDTFFESAFTS